MVVILAIATYLDRRGMPSLQPAPAGVVSQGSQRESTTNAHFAYSVTGLPAVADLPPLPIPANPPPTLITASRRPRPALRRRRSRTSSSASNGEVARNCPSPTRVPGREVTSQPLQAVAAAPSTGGITYGHGLSVGGSPFTE